MADDYRQLKCERLEEVSQLCDSLRSRGEYEAIKQLLGHELVKASEIADSCVHSSYLFSTLALAYEELGDTLMPDHFHYKAQELAATYQGLLAGIDSVEVYRLRMHTLQEFVNQTKTKFNREDIGYLVYMNQIASEMFYFGNTLETIYLGEKVIKLAADSLVTDDKEIGTIYAQLLSSHSWENNMERVNQLLPIAVQFYNKYPELGENEASLNLYIAQYAIDRNDYKSALPFLEKAEDTEKDKQSERYLYIKDLIRLCKEKD